MTSSRAAQQVLAFHHKFSFPATPLGPPRAPDDGLKALRAQLLIEEATEYLEALSTDDVVGIADALGDMLYVIYGTALTYGIDLDAVVDEIHRSNMSKETSATGKAKKGADYSPPNLNQVLWPDA